MTPSLEAFLLLNDQDEAEAATVRAAVLRLEAQDVSDAQALAQREGVHPLSFLISKTLLSGLDGDSEPWLTALDQAWDRGFSTRLSTDKGERDAGHEALDVLISVRDGLLSDDGTPEEESDPGVVAVAVQLLDGLLRRGWSPYEEGAPGGKDGGLSVGQRIHQGEVKELEPWLAEHEATLIDLGLPTAHEGIPSPRF